MVQKKRRLAVIGAGISGLSACYFLRKKYPKASISLFEKEKALGGLIQTENKEGLIFEKGPHTYDTHRSKELLTLIEELALEKDLLFSNSTAKKRYIYDGKKLQKIPTSLLEIPFSPLTRGHLLSLALEWRRKSEAKEESIHSFFTRRLGVALTQKLIEPICKGIWGGSIETLSMQACMGGIKDMERAFGSLTKALWVRRHKKRQSSSLFTLKPGMQWLLQKLFEKASLDEVYYNTSIETLDLKEDKISLHWEGKSLSFDGVILGVNLKEASLLLGHLEEAAYLKTIPSFSLQVVHLAFKEKLFYPHGFGCLIPGFLNEEVLGILFDSDIFERDNSSTLFTLMLKDTVVDPQKVATQALQKYLKLSVIPSTYLHTTYEEAIPQYPLYHLQQIQILENSLQSQYPHLGLAGNYLRGVSVNDCISSAKQSVIRLI